MLTFKFTQVNGTMSEADTLTSGMVGKQCKLEFSSEWDGMQKTAVFTAGTTVRDVVNVEEIVEIPAECLVRPNTRLYVGVYGVADGGRVIPTIIVPGPYIIPGADPSGDESTNPELPVWAQLQEQINDLQAGGGAGGGGTAIQPDWNQNDEMAPDYVKGRTHYVEKKIVEETRVLYSDHTQPMDSFWETLYENRQTALYQENDKEYRFVRDLEPGVDVPPNVTVWEVASETRYYYIRVRGDYIDLTPFPPPEDPTEVLGLHITVPIETEVVHKLDEKFIPDSIPSVATAGVGQTIVVKAVDADGKPVEWEAVDMPEILEQSDCGIFKIDLTSDNIVMEGDIDYLYTDNRDDLVDAINSKKRILFRVNAPDITTHKCVSEMVCWLMPGSVPACKLIVPGHMQAINLICVSGTKVPTF